jgi:preprotein translocase subunit SecD
LTVGARGSRSGKAGVSGLFSWCAAVIVAIFTIAAAIAQPLLLDVQSTGVAYDPGTGEPIVMFRFTPASARLFADFTRNNIGRRMTISVDGRVYTEPTIREPITGGAGQLMGGFSVREAKTLATRLTAGGAKVEVALVED